MRRSRITFTLDIIDGDGNMKPILSGIRLRYTLSPQRDFAEVKASLFYEPLSSHVLHHNGKDIFVLFDLLDLHLKMKELKISRVMVTSDPEVDAVKTKALEGAMYSLGYDIL